MKLEIVVLGEGLTEQLVMPIIFQRCVHYFQKDADVIMIEFVENPATKDSKLFSLLKKTYLRYSTKFSADILLVGRDNDNKQKHPPHSKNHTEKAEIDCFFCKLKQEIENTEKSDWLIRKVPTVIFVPVEAIESWLLFQADIVKRKRESFPEDFTRFDAKLKLCGTLDLTRQIIEKYHKPIAEKMDIHALRQNVKSFDLSYIPQLPGEILGIMETCRNYGNL